MGLWGGVGGTGGLGGKGGLGGRVAIFLQSLGRTVYKSMTVEPGVRSIFGVSKNDPHPFPNSFMVLSVRFICTIVNST